MESPHDSTAQSPDTALGECAPVLFEVHSVKIDEASQSEENDNNSSISASINSKQLSEFHPVLDPSLSPVPNHPNLTPHSQIGASLRPHDHLHKDNIPLSEESDINKSLSSPLNPSLYTLPSPHILEEAHALYSPPLQTLQEPQEKSPPPPIDAIASADLSPGIESLQGAIYLSSLDIYCIEEHLTSHKYLSLYNLSHQKISTTGNGLSNKQKLEWNTVHLYCALKLQFFDVLTFFFSNVLHINEHLSLKDTKEECQCGAQSDSFIFANCYCRDHPINTFLLTFAALAPLFEVAKSILPKTKNLFVVAENQGALFKTIDNLWLVMEREKELLRTHRKGAIHDLLIIIHVLIQLFSLTSSATTSLQLLDQTEDFLLTEAKDIQQPPTLLYTLIEIWISQHRLQLAIELCNARLQEVEKRRLEGLLTQEKHPELTYYNQLGMAAFNEALYDEAAEYFQKVIEGSSKSQPSVSNNLAVTMWHKMDLPRSIQVLQNLLWGAQNPLMEGMEKRPVSTLSFLYEFTSNPKVTSHALQTLLFSSIPEDSAVAQALLLNSNT